MAPGSLTHPAFAPFRGALEELLPLTPSERLAWLNEAASRANLRTGGGRPLHFVEAPGSRSSADAAHGYECRVALGAGVPTRLSPPGDWHDLCNALMWLEFPRSKAALNALHAEQIRVAASSETGPVPGVPRGCLRDLLTLLDESGVLWVSADRDLARALRAFDWQSLFVRDRARIRDAVTVRVLGHGLLLKCANPYKALTGHALVLELPADSPIEVLDTALAEQIRDFGRTLPVFCPLPVLGVPGWDRDNERPDYYDDPQVFRAGRRRTRNLMRGEGR